MTALRRILGRAFVLASGAVVVAACGGAAQKPTSPAQPERAGPEEAPKTTSPSPAAAAPPAGAPPAAADAAESHGSRQAALRAARAELAVAERDLESGQAECAAACRALGSMERATGHLCDLATDTDDRRRCEEAKTRVLRARHRVRTACGTCPDGPILDPSAPIPSRP